MTMYTPSKIIIIQGLKELALKASKKKLNLFMVVFSNKAISQLSPLNMCNKKNTKKIQNGGIFMIYSSQPTFIQSFNLIR